MVEAASGSPLPGVKLEVEKDSTADMDELDLEVVVVIGVDIVRELGIVTGTTSKLDGDVSSFAARLDVGDGLEL